jgi:DNA-binding transcriptional regulator YiaG
MELPPNRIEALREAHGLSRVEVAAVCGVVEMTIRRWELNESAVPDQQKFRLAELFSVEVVHLMGWDHDTEKVAAA